MSTLVFCSAALVLLFAGLSVNVSRMRLKRRKSPEVSEAAMNKAIRAHGNAAEYVPLLVALFLYVHATQPSPGIYLVGSAVVGTVSRFAHAAGMFRIANVGERHPLRFYGALGTYTVLIPFGAALVLRAVQAA